MSITDANDLTEFLNTAVLAGTEFEAEKESVVILDNSAFRLHETAEPSPEQLLAQLKHQEDLRIPRRPKWTASTTPEQLDRLEKDSFLEWRRELV